MEPELNNNNLDLLDLEDDEILETLPESSPFATPRAKRPWLLMGVGLIVIALATFIIIRTIGTDSGSSVEIDLDAPDVISVETPDSDTIIVPEPSPTPTPVAVKPVDAPKPVAKPKPVADPVRTVSDRKEVKFDEKKTATVKPAPVKSATKPQAAKPAASGWYVQFGSFNTRVAAENAQKKIQSGHASLFGGKSFVILAAQLPNGTTTYRLRVGFTTSSEANGFCQNAKSDGLDCYVAK